MSSDLGSASSDAPPIRRFWSALAGAAVAAAAALIVGLIAGNVHGWLKWPIGALALIMLVAFNLKCCTAGEYLSKAKGVYHPMYGSNGALGLLLAVFARRQRGA
ncbi:MAG TPA: hypothetical protein VGL05_18885 [Kribbella sp.]